MPYSYIYIPLLANSTLLRLLPKSVTCNFHPFTVKFHYLPIQRPQRVSYYLINEHNDAFLSYANLTLPGGFDSSLVTYVIKHIRVILSKI